MNEASSSNIGGVLKRKKNDNSEGDLYNGTVSDKRMKIDHGPVELPSILTRSNFNNSSQSSQFDDSEHQYFTDLQRNSRVRADSDPFQINSENKDSFQKLSVGNEGSVERRSQSELQVLYPESHSIYTDDKSESEASSPDCIDSSEPKKNIENYPPTYMHTPCYSNIQASVGSNIVTTWSKFRDMAINQKPAALNDRPCSLPQIPWGKREAFWQMICNRDSATVTYRNPEYHDCHEHITPRMRAILLDWLILVSSHYELHRETYYLSMDYLDRYLSNSDSIPNQKLQLIGITCLFMAAKMEEIYPPKLTAFVHVTDGACTTEDVLDMEKKLLMYLRFRLTPVSINYWVQLMLQFICVNDSTAEDSLIVPQFPKHLFNRVAHLLDLASLDSNSLRYSYSELAASALTIILNKKIALTISGLSEGNIYNCVEWMSVYWSVILEEYQYKEIDFENDSEQEDGTHVKQRHLVSMDMYDLAQSRFELIQLSRVTPSNLLTPPWNGKKYPVTAEECKPSCSYK